MSGEIRVAQGDKGKHQPHHTSLAPLPRICNVGGVSLLLIRQATVVPQRTYKYHLLPSAYLPPTVSLSSPLFSSPWGCPFPTDQAGTYCVAAHSAAQAPLQRLQESRPHTHPSPCRTDLRAVSFPLIRQATIVTQRT